MKAVQFNIGGCALGDESLSVIPCHRCRRRRHSKCILFVFPATEPNVRMHWAVSSHERALGDFDTALTLVRRKKQTEDELDGATRPLRETSSAAELLQDNDEGPGGVEDGKAAAATTSTKHEETYGGSGGGGGDASPRTPDERRSPGASNASGGVGHTQPCLAEEPGHHEEPHDEDGRLKTGGGDGSRRRSQGADGGDGMAEGGSVLGACHYARWVLDIYRFGPQVHSGGKSRRLIDAAALSSFAPGGRKTRYFQLDQESV